MMSELLPKGQDDNCHVSGVVKPFPLFWGNVHCTHACNVSVITVIQNRLTGNSSVFFFPLAALLKYN